MALVELQKKIGDYGRWIQWLRVEKRLFVTHIHSQLTPSLEFRDRPDLAKNRVFEFG